MTKYSKFNIIYRLQKWLDSVPGQTFMNYAYSWGASIVILGTLFKLTHLPGANFMLFLGMGTEVVVFFIAAFDRPFDKTADGMDLPTHVQDESEENGMSIEGGAESSAATQPGGTVIIGGGVIGGVAGGGNHIAAYEEGSETATGGGVVVGTTGVGGGVTGGTISGGGGVIGGGVGGGTSVIGGGGVIGGGAGELIAAAQQETLPMADELKDATSKYIDELNNLSEMLAKVSEQSERLTRDSEEMENLNRTLTGISRVYELQLKSASAQVSTIDEIDAQTRHLAEQIVELNKIYARMIEAMQVRAGA